MFIGVTHDQAHLDSATVEDFHRIETWMLNTEFKFCSSSAPLFVVNLISLFVVTRARSDLPDLVLSVLSNTFYQKMQELSTDPLWD